MSNSLQVFAGSAISTPEEFDKAVDAGLSKAPAVSGNTPFLKLDQKTGRWIYGTESVEVEDGSEWAVNPGSLRHGYVCWSNPEKTGRKLELLGELFERFDVDLPPPTTLPDHTAAGGIWKDAVSFDLQCIKGEDEGEATTYNASSQGGARAYRDILSAIRNRPSKEHFIPVVTLGETNYKSKFGSKVYNPVFEVVDWADTNGDRLGSPQAETEAEADEGAAPTRRRRRSA